MAKLSLHDIEKTLSTLWTERLIREAFLNETKTKTKKSGSQLSVLSKEVLSQVDTEGICIYSSLMSLGKHELMSSIYPGCAKLIGNKWGVVVEDFFYQYKPSHYNLNQSARQFPDYLNTYGACYLKQFPFLVELADHEWLELELMESDIEVVISPFEPLSSPEQFDKSAPRINPVLAIRQYHYAIPSIVDQIKSNHSLSKNTEPKQTSVVAYRDPLTHHCRFLELGEITVKIIEAATSKPTAYRELAGLAILLSEGLDPQQVVIEFLEIIEKLQSTFLFIGSVAI